MALKPTTTPGFVRDTRTNAVLNTNESEYRHFCAARDRAKKLRALENEVGSIKQLIAQLLQKKA